MRFAIVFNGIFVSVAIAQSQIGDEDSAIWKRMFTWQAFARVKGQSRAGENVSCLTGLKKFIFPPHSPHWTPTRPDIHHTVCKIGHPPYQTLTWCGGYLVWWMSVWWMWYNRAGVRRVSDIATLGIFVHTLISSWHCQHKVQHTNKYLDESLN